MTDKLAALADRAYRIRRYALRMGEVQGQGYIGQALGMLVLREVGYASPALALPVLIIVFLRFGVATPTEVSVISTLYAAVVSMLVYRDLTLQRVKAAVLEAGIATGVVLLVIMRSEPTNRSCSGTLLRDCNRLKASG